MKIKRISFNPHAVLDGGRDHIQHLTGAECSVSLEAGGQLVRVRMPEKRCEFSVPASNCTIEHEWLEDEPRTAPDKPVQGKFRP